MELTKLLLKHGYELALEINASIFLIFTETGRSYDVFKDYLTHSKFDKTKPCNDTVENIDIDNVENPSHNVGKFENKDNKNNKEDEDNKNNKYNKNNIENSIKYNTYNLKSKKSNYPINKKHLKIIVSTPNEDTYFRLKNEKGIIPILMNYRNRYRTTMVKQSIVKLFENNLVKNGDLIVSIVGAPKVSGGTDTISIIKVDDHNPILKFHQYINSLEKIKALVINEVLNIAMELGVEGREGKPVGTIFVVGDTENVLKMSSQLILNPFEHHKAVIFDKKVKGTIKELSSIDGAFIISEKGEVKSAGRYIECTSGNLTLPLGLGARHYAAAAVSKYTDAIAITVSESGGIVRVFKDGEILVEINPNRLDDENSYVC